MNDRGILATYLLSPLSLITNPENKSQFKQLKDPNSNSVNGLLIDKKLPVTLYKILLTFRDTDKKFVLPGGLLKMITNTKYNADHANLSENKILYDFAKERFFDVKGPGNESPRGRSVIRLLKSPAVMASEISTNFLPENTKELCDRLKLLLQEKQAGNNSNLIKEQSIIIVDKLLEYKCMSKKQHKQFLIKCNLSHRRRNQV